MVAPKTIRNALCVAAMTVLAGMPIATRAQVDFPNRLVIIIVPAPPGPVIDALPRVVAPKLATLWAQTVIVENKPGAATLIGTEAVPKAPADGHTLLVSPPGQIVINPNFLPKPNVDATALVPVTVLAKLPAVLVVNAKLPVYSVKDLIALARQNPGKFTYGSPGIGTGLHLAMEKLRRQAGLDLVHVPYQGLGPEMQDLLAGRIDMMVDVLGDAWPHINSGALRLLATTAPSRLAELPDVPTISETVPDYVHSEWFAILAPPKTPAGIVAKLQQAVAQALKQPDVAQRFADFHVIAGGESPAETAAFIEEDNKRWVRLSVSMGHKFD
jgi:tripartite-type tricarboxylate transporter receptor subunit TctC